MRTKTYATFGFSRSFRQLLHALQSRRDAEQNMALLFLQLKKHEQLIELQLRRPVRGLQILEVGPGQGMERARYFGVHNAVTGLDLDVIPKGFDLTGYWQMIQKNGFGRFLKTTGRRLVVAGPNRSGWEKAVGERGMRDPILITGDICAAVPGTADFDVAVSWSVFEHLPDPAKALQNLIGVLKPGGVLFTSIHLYTANNGHHDIRAFTGQEESLPPWGHLRRQTRDLIQPSAYLNRWRLEQWRRLFSDLAPGHEEYLETQNGKYTNWMTGDIRKELSDYSDEELFTIDAIYIWRKPNINDSISGPGIPEAVPAVDSRTNSG